MTRRSITAVLAPLLVGLLISVGAPAVGADALCILDNAGNCAAQVAPRDGQAEYDMIRTALEMVGTATTVPVAADVTGPAGEPYQQTTTWSVNP